MKYILDGKIDHNIPAIFVEPFQELERTGRRVAKKTESTVDGRHNSDQLVVSGSGASKKGRKRSGKLPNTFNNETSSASNGSITTSNTTIEKSSSSSTRHCNSNGSSNSIDASSVPSSSSSSSSSESRIDRRSQKLVILTSTASFEVESTLEAFAQHFSKPPLPSSSSSTVDYCDSIRIATRFDSAVTHLVVAVGADKVLRQRTMKYMQALVCKWTTLTYLQSIHPYIIYTCIVVTVVLQY